MKKWLVVLLFLGITLYSAAQEKSESSGPLSAGIGPEFNMNSRHNFAGGTVLGIYFNLPKNSAIGLTSTVDFNFFNTEVLEFAVLYRRFFGDGNYSGFFLQPEAGIFIIFEDGEVIPLPLFGLRGGYRLPLGSRFYIEPCGRLGYPFAFGIAFMAGITF